MTSPSLPHRFREEAFRRYEHAIADVVKAYPNRVLFLPSSYGLAVTTFTCRFRDAMTSYLNNNWTSTLVDRKTFEQCHRRLDVIELDDGSGFVAAGDRSLVRKRTAFIPILTTTRGEEPTKTVVPLASRDEQKLICSLAALRLLQPCRVSGITPDDVVFLEQNYDVALVQQPDGTYLLT